MKSDKNQVVVADMFNLIQLAYLVKQCKIYFCTDTGPLHLAIAMGVPTISFLDRILPTSMALFQIRNISIFMKMFLAALALPITMRRCRSAKSQYASQIFLRKELLTLLVFLLKNVLTDTISLFLVTQQRDLQKRFCFFRQKTYFYIN